MVEQDLHYIKGIVVDYFVFEWSMDVITWCTFYSQVFIYLLHHHFTCKASILFEEFHRQVLPNLKIFLSVLVQKRRINPLLTSWSYFFLALSHRYSIVKLHVTLTPPLFRLRVSGDASLTANRGINSYAIMMTYNHLQVSTSVAPFTHMG